MARLHTLEDIYEAGRQHCLAAGWRPTPAQAAQLAALLRPYLDRRADDTTQTAS